MSENDHGPGTPSTPPSWTIAKNAERYQINGWGEPYFRINEAGHVEVRPDPERDRAIDLFELVMQLDGRGLELPLLIRFPNILRDRIRIINNSFQRACAEYD